MCSADPGREAHHVPSPGECGFPIHHSTQNRCEQPAARGEERCAARYNYELQTNKKKEKMTKTQQAVSSVNAFSPGPSILGIKWHHLRNTECPSWNGFPPPPPSACFSFLGSVSHNAMPPGPGEGSWDSCWVSHFNQFIIEMSMPSNWVQLGRTLWFTEKLLERNSFLAERPIVCSSWHRTGMVRGKMEPREGMRVERTDSGTRGQRLLQQTLLFNLELWEPINSPSMFGFEFSIY